MGNRGSGDGQFWSAGGIATDSGGNVYVADTRNDRVQVFTATGEFIRKWGGSGTGNGRFGEPVGITVDSADQVYVVDNSLDVIQKFSATGAFIEAWGTSGSGNGQFKTPADVVTDSSGNVYVPDADLDRIEKFALLGGPPPPSPGPEITPGTQITKASVNKRKRRARFEFKAIGAAIGFECSLAKRDAAPKFRPCDSPRAYKHLKRRAYVFEVRAVGTAGADKSPAKKTFRMA